MQLSSLHQKTSQSSLQFRKDIEGLRAIAILLVVFYHAELTTFSGGYIGVDVFFVLSGYLITWLLVKEAEETGSIDLWRFYSRRARRLLPAMALMLAITVPMGAILLAPIEQRIYANSAISTAAYLSNLYFAKESTNYLGTDSENNPFLHTWSLSVEEQFYFFWPVFVMFSLGVLGRKKKCVSRKKLIFYMTLAATLSFVATVYLAKNNQPWAFFMSPARAWEFALGAMAVLIPHSSLERSRLISSVSGWLGLIGISIVALVYSKSTPFPGWLSLPPVLSTIIILRSGSYNQESLISKLLCWRPLQEIGRLSYSWYLWHWPVLVLAAAIKPNLTKLENISLLILALIISEISYRYVENPIRHHKWLSKNAFNSLAMALVLTVCTIGYSYTWRYLSLHWEKLPEYTRYSTARNDVPEIYESNCHADFPDVEIDIGKCTIGDKDADKTMVLYGDSHAAQWYPALKEIVKMNNQWRLVTITKSGCATVGSATYNKQLKREYTECLEWQKNALVIIEKLKPNYTFYSTSTKYGIAEDEFLNGIRKTIEKLRKMSLNLAILADTPSFDFDPVLATQRSKWQEKLIAKNNIRTSEPMVKKSILKAQLEIFQEMPKTEIIDMNKVICPNEECHFETLQGDITFRDSHHITASYSKSLANELIRAINKAFSFSFTDEFRTTAEVKKVHRSQVSQ